ncbi:head-tail adaptor protein [Pelagovum pacificum]|uniref:Head-tail adaptor protein n=1 Tax=Pelagovum pacificum TaxID=2588711 RepID=A0A5C5GAY0_9RHOB|nr:head-tail adaptor protein [Pelagovum pacificum]QQA41240.1 head-tail adaptor protein [Pelagovum pacificum]TNY31952.1 head-tail adaptor protein [Pelagovum pacificum]
MSFPRLTRQLVLEAPERLPDGSGGYSESWVPLGTVFAEVQGRTGRETRGPAVPLSTARYSITLRAAPWGTEARPRPGQRFREGDRLFPIEAVVEADADARFITCHCEEEVVA